MGNKSKIEWTDNTFNLVHGCVKVSEACLHCYAEQWDSRHLYSDDSHWGSGTSRLKMSEFYWAQPIAWNRKAVRDGASVKVFCSSMADVFEDHPDVTSERQKLWELILATPNLTWQLLTKRPQNILKMIPVNWAENGLPDNVWALTSAENQVRFDERVQHLRNVPARVLGFSCEPLLSAIEFRTALDRLDSKHLWVIAGGESGRRIAEVRPSAHGWFAGIRDQCVQRGIPFFFKQWGNRHEDGVFTSDKSYRTLDGKEWDQFPDE